MDKVESRDTSVPYRNRNNWASSGRAIQFTIERESGKGVQNLNSYFPLIHIAITTSGQAFTGTLKPMVKGKS